MKAGEPVNQNLSNDSTKQSSHGQCSELHYMINTWCHTMSTHNYVSPSIH